MSVQKVRIFAVSSCCLALTTAAINLWVLHYHSSPWMTPLTFVVAIMACSWALGQLHEYRGQRMNARASSPENFSIVSTSSNRHDKVAARPLHAFTIDLEDYFHTEVASRTVDINSWDQMPSRIESSVHRLLDLLDEHQTRATVFTLGWIAHKYPELIREVSARGHEIGCHSYQHRVVSRMTPQAFHADTLLAKEILEDVVGRPVIGYRAPNFSITPGTEWAFEILEDLGFLYDSSVNPVRHRLYGNHTAPRFPYFVPKTKLLEIPIATWRVGGCNLPIGGGAYLRLLPYAYTRLGLAAQKSHSATMYMHPWEIDHYQPVIAQDWKSRIRQTGGTTTMEAKLVRLFESARFAPITEVYCDELHHTFSAVPALPRQISHLARVV